MALRGTLDHPKLLSLADALDVDQCHALGILEAVWHFTAQYTPEGDIGRFSNRAIANGVRTSIPADTLIEALCVAGWLDQDDEHRLIVHDWHEHTDNRTRSKVQQRGRPFVSGSDDRRNTGGRPPKTANTATETANTPANAVTETADTKKSADTVTAKITARARAPVPEPEPVPEPVPVPETKLSTTVEQPAVKKPPGKQTKPAAKQKASPQAVSLAPPELLNGQRRIPGPGPDEGRSQEELAAIRQRLQRDKGVEAGGMKPITAFEVNHG